MCNVGLHIKKHKRSPSREPILARARADPYIEHSRSTFVNRMLQVFAAHVMTPWHPVYPVDCSYSFSASGRNTTERFNSLFKSSDTELKLLISIYALVQKVFYFNSNF